MEVDKYTYGEKQITEHWTDTGQKLYIGKFCSIAKDVNVFLGGEHPTNWGTTYPFGDQNTNEFKSDSSASRPLKGDVRIGNDVWIAHGVSIMSGITIGDGAVIGAYSHVVKDVGPYEIWGGNPAKLIRKRFSDDIINILVQVKWWNRSIEDINKIIPLLQQPMTLEIATQIRFILN